MFAEISGECCLVGGFLSNGVLVRPGQLLRYSGERIVPFKRPAPVFANYANGQNDCMGMFLGLRVPNRILLLQNGGWSELPVISSNPLFTSALALNQYCGLLPIWFYTETEAFWTIPRNS